MSVPVVTSPDSAPETSPDLPDIVLNPVPIHRGPFAAIYRGWDRVLRCDVIAKVQRATDDTVAMERFRREAIVMGRLRHPNIVTLYRFYEDHPATLVMEYVPGQTLAALVAADGWLPSSRAAGIIKDIAAALDCAHAQNIVHRDVKPSNILLPRRGPARLTDFGVAHIDDDVPLTVMGDMLGTIEYASPEQVHGNETPDGRSDVYSLAAVTYFALTGTPPFRAADNSTQAQLSVMHRQVFAEPPSLRFHREDLSPEIEAVVLRGLAKAPESRFSSAGQFAAALCSAAELEHSPEHRARAAAVNRTSALAGALAGVGLFLVAGFGLWQARHPASPSRLPAPHSSLHPLETGHSLRPAPPTAVTPKHPLPIPLPVLVKAPPTKPIPSKPAAVVVKPVSKPVAVAVKPPIAAPQKPAAGIKSPLVVKVATKLAAPKPVKIAVKPPVHPEPLKIVIKPVPAPKIAPPKKTLVALLATPKPNPAVPPKRTALGAAPKSAGAPAQGWLYVYADQDIATPGRPSHMGRVRAQAVYIDGRSVPALAAGQWVPLPAGPHHISFFPDVRSGFGPHTGVLVTLASGTRVLKQILLPRMTNTTPRTAALPPAPRVAASFIAWLYVYGVRAVSSSSRKPEIVRIAALSVALDGHPIPELASGQWARVTAGTHVLRFIPRSGTGAGSATMTIHLSPQAHLLQQVPLPSVTSTVVHAPIVHPTATPPLVTPSPATPPSAAHPPTTASPTVASPPIPPPATPSPHLRNP